MSNSISLLSSSSGFTSRGLTSSHHSILHETSQPTQACHDKIHLPAGLVVCLDSDGRAHQIILHIDFFDKSGKLVNPAKWNQVWSSVIEEKKSKGTLSYLGLPIEPEQIGLRIRAVNVGRRASVDWSLVEDDDAPFHCRYGCKRYKIIGNDTAKPKIVESLDAGVTARQRTVHTPYGTVRYDPKVLPRGHIVGSRSTIDYLDN